MRALQFATATANLASQNAFLFLVTHGPIFIASSSSATLIQCGFQYRRWNCSPIPPLVVKVICFSAFLLFCFSAFRIIRHWAD